MKTIKKIAVGIDFSVYSPDIMKYAAGIAERNSAEIVIVHVINKHHIQAVEKAINEEAPPFILEKFINDATRKRAADIDELRRKWVPGKVRTRTVIRSGVPFEEILDVVDDEGIDLLVISSRGRTNFRDYMFGTTAEKIFRHCPISLLSLNLSIEA
jgi:nucleotide-binding universal stress UspA family protein